MTGRTLLVAALLLGFGISSAPGAAMPTVEAGTVDQFHAALAAKDRDGALALLAPDVVIFESGGAEMSRDEYADHHLGGDMEFVAATKNEIVDRRTGGSGELAWVITRSKTTGTFRGNEVGAHGTETMLLARTAEG
ncbi:MAG: YybH family protein, partial [Candidatus Binatia bacterium]